MELTSLADAQRSTLLEPKEVAQGRWYGTRVSTVVVVMDDGECVFEERDVSVQDQDGVRMGDGKRRFRFSARDAKGS